MFPQSLFHWVQERDRLIISHLKLYVSSLVRVLRSFLAVLQLLMLLKSFIFAVHRVIATVAHAFGVIEVILMVTLGGHLVSSIDMVAIIAHATSVVLGVYVFAVGHLFSSSSSFAILQWFQEILLHLRLCKDQNFLLVMQRVIIFLEPGIRNLLDHLVLDLAIFYRVHLVLISI